MKVRQQPPGEGRGKRLLWFVVLYVASLAVFTALVYGLRGIMPH